MRGEKLNQFCEALCSAIAKGEKQFRFDGDRWLTTDATEEANRCIKAEEDDEDLPTD